MKFGSINKGGKIERKIQVEGKTNIQWEANGSFW